MVSYIPNLYYILAQKGALVPETCAWSVTRASPERPAEGPPACAAVGSARVAVDPQAP